MGKLGLACGASVVLVGKAQEDRWWGKSDVGESGLECKTDL